MHEIKITGSTNFRSLGGLPAGDGRRLRPHALMRADRLVGLDQEDLVRARDVAVVDDHDLGPVDGRIETDLADPPGAPGVQAQVGIASHILRTDAARLSV